VSAASSLTDVFTVIEVRFENQHPGVDVRLNLAGSSTLREQILGGAPVHVFASADPQNMEAVTELLVDPAATFATNRLVLAVPAGNPGGIGGIDDLARDDLLIGTCAPQVPCGRLAAAVIETAGVAPAIDTREPDVRSLVTKLEAGELDAGLVYLTDALRTPGIEMVGDPFRPSTEYRIAVVDPDEYARDFVAFVLSEEGRAILASHGFELP
jgi:molybdate transport system substrate-binding protein